MPAPMTPDEVNDFLDSRPGWIVLTTIGKDGYPHSIPIGYFRLGDDIVMGCRADTQKTLNVERVPRVSLMLESGSTMADIKGVLIQGDAEVVANDAAKLELARAPARARGVPDDQLPKEPSPTAAYIRVRRRRVISWDYGKQG